MMIHVFVLGMQHFDILTMTTFTYFASVYASWTRQFDKPSVHSFIFLGGVSQSLEWRNGLMLRQTKRLLTELVENFLMMVFAVHNMAAILKRYKRRELV